MLRKNLGAVKFVINIPLPILPFWNIAEEELLRNLTDEDDAPEDRAILDYAKNLAAIRLDEPWGIVKEIMQQIARDYPVFDEAMSQRASSNIEAEASELREEDGNLKESTILYTVTLRFNDRYEFKNEAEFKMNRKLYHDDMITSVIVYKRLNADPRIGLFKMTRPW
jgi:hypothetical protein